MEDLTKDVSRGLNLSFQVEKTHSLFRSRTETDASEGHAEGLSGHGRQGGAPAAQRGQGAEATRGGGLSGNTQAGR